MSPVARSVHMIMYDRPSCVGLVLIVSAGELQPAKTKRKTKTCSRFNQNGFHGHGWRWMMAARSTGASFRLSPRPLVLPLRLPSSYLRKDTWRG